jgi:hypothetical protein
LLFSAIRDGSESQIENSGLRSRAIVRFLIEASGGLSVSDENGRTLLKLARKGGDEELVRLLVNAGASDAGEVGGRRARRTREGAGRSCRGGEQKAKEEFSGAKLGAIPARMPEGPEVN